jgi:hypothetical protein
MILDELLPTLRDLNRADKLRAIQFLAAELAKEENLWLDANAEYPVWTPVDAFEAAKILSDILLA